MYKLSTQFLVVEDHPAMRKFIVQTLTDLGFNNITEACDGKMAFDLLVNRSKTAEPIEFVISDWNMPHMEGIDLLKLCRQTEAFKTIPFILATGERDQSQIIEAAKAGVSGYIIKPFAALKIKSTIDNIFKKTNLLVRVA